MLINILAKSSVKARTTNSTIQFLNFEYKKHKEK